MSQFIKERIKEWRPLLQDDEGTVVDTIDPDSDDRLTLEGEDETTIVEFPLEIKNNLRHANDTSESYQAIQRYKLLRNKIKSVLDTEAVSHKTKKLVTNTLDDMIAHMIGNQCNWKNGIDKRPKAKSKNRVDPIAMARTWNEEWQKLKFQYLDTVKTKKEEKNPLFQQFQHLISNITKDIKLLSKDYRIECRLVVDDEEKRKEMLKVGDLDQIRTMADKNILKDKDQLKNLNANDSTCDTFKLCSDELSDYLNDFYINLNESVVTTLTNYAAMYSRDVVDEDERDAAISLVLYTSRTVRDTIKTIFKRHTMKIKFSNDKNKDVNIKALNEYIDRIMKSTKKRVKNVLANNLQSLKARLMDTISKDVSVNLDVELGNLERDLRGRICTIFELCNGRYISRRRQEGGKLIGDKNSVYVKVHLALDDNIKDQLNINPIFRRNNPLEVPQQNTAYNRYMMFTKPSIGPINVTRTTLFVSFAQNVTDTPSMKLNEIDSNLDNTKT